MSIFGDIELKPLCISAGNDTRYATAFAYYRDFSSEDKSNYPSWLVVMKSLDLGYVKTKDDSGLRWDILAGTPRANVNLMPDVDYDYACAVGVETGVFILRARAHVGNGGYPTMPFTIHLPLALGSKAALNVSSIADSRSNLTGGDQSWTGSYGGSSVIIPFNNFLENVPNRTITDDIDKRWIMASITSQDTNTISFAASVKGSFPSNPQSKWSNLFNETQQDISMVTYERPSLFTLGTVSDRTFLSSIPLGLNPDNVTIAGFNSSSISQKQLPEDANCSNAKSVMTVESGTAHILCYDDN
ncbi:hypothetical protein BGX27_004288, partial [Mortierella sp. AM989]